MEIKVMRAWITNSGVVKTSQAVNMTLDCVYCALERRLRFDLKPIDCFKADIFGWEVGDAVRRNFRRNAP